MEIALEEYVKALHKQLQDDTNVKLGVKYDSDKPKWNLLPWDELEDVVKVLTFGAKKYAPDNWKFVDDANNRSLCCGTIKMTMLLRELMERLKTIDETALLDLLQITSEELVNRFSDEIEDNMNKLIKELDD